MVGFSEHHWFGSRHVVVILLTLSQTLFINYVYVADQLYRRTYQQSYGSSDIFHTLNDIPREHVKYYHFVSEILETILTIISGILTLKISNKYFLLLSNVLNTVISFALPFLLKYAKPYAFGITMLMFCVARSIHWCTTLCVIGKWTPTHETSRSLATVFSFSYVLGGAVFTIAEVVRKETNHPNSFYFLGSVSTMWLILWLLFGAGSPDDCAFTTEGEKKYIYKSLEFVRPRNSKTPIPWKAIIKCRSLYAISVAITSFYLSFTSLAFSEMHWGSIFSIMLSQSKEQVEKNIVPRMFGFPIFAFFMAYITDKLTAHYHWPCSYFRKIFSSVGCYGACICLSFTLYINGPNSVTMFVIATYFYATQISNAYFNALLDISPTYVGITSALAGTPYMIVQSVLTWYGKTSTSAKTLDQLTHIFEATILLLLFGNTIFCMGIYEKKPFDLVGTVPWKRESVQSYPAVKI